MEVNINNDSNKREYINSTEVNKKVQEVLLSLQNFVNNASSKIKNEWIPTAKEFGGISFVASRRQNRNYEKLARTTTFHCLHCDSIYTSRESKDIENCPACGYKNPRLKF